MFENLTPEQKYIMKSKYKNKAVIYLWLNKLNGRCYIGSTVNLSSRLANYFDSYYLNNTKNKMAICAALLQYGYTNFNLYVLETFPELITLPGVSQPGWEPRGTASAGNLASRGGHPANREIRTQLLIREDYFVSLVKPSYNIAAILNTFVGENHPRYGKSVSQEVKDKISKSLTGRKPSEEAIENHRKGAHKKPVYCYDFFTKEFVVNFESIRFMSRSLDMGPISIQRKIDNNKPFNCVYKGVPQTWVLYLNPISTFRKPCFNEKVTGVNSGPSRSDLPVNRGGHLNYLYFYIRSSTVIDAALSPPSLFLEQAAG